VNLQEEIDQRKANGLYRERRSINSAQGATIEIDGKQYINFSSNDYLGFANNAELKSCMIDAINKYGIGSASSQLIVGHLTPHKKLEEKLSKFLKRDAALVFPTGYQANLAIASTLIDSKTIVLQDKLNHASLVDAAMLSKGKLVRYRHSDMDHLKILLEKHKQNNLVVMTDGIFSMDGDYASLIGIAELCKTYNALLIVDDAHGLGVLGKTGAGLLEELKLNQQQVPLLVGTFGKSFGASGAFISGSHLHIEAFVQKARTYIYTTALLPSIAATMINAIDLVVGNKRLRKNIVELVVHYKNQMKKEGLKVSEIDSHIQPLIIGEAYKALAVSKSLYEKNIVVTAIRPPTVPKGSSRLRISINATHTTSQIDKLVSATKQALSENE
jgi:8-amino-7-oxononanoate synthase